MKTDVLPLLTLADLDATPDDGNRYELIDGEVYMSRAPQIYHQHIIGNLYYALTSYLRANKIGRVMSGIGVILSDFDAVIPDLVFVTNGLYDEIERDGRLTAAPELAIEVVSPGAENERRDRFLKRKLYGRYDVQEYWIIDPQARTLEIYLARGSGLELATTLREGDALTSSLLPDFNLSVAEIFV